MKLLYSTAFGPEHYFLLANEMVKSARRQGFTGEIVILTDKPYQFDGAIAHVLEMTERDLWRTSIWKAVDVESYEKILYVDTDFVFTGNPEKLMESDKVAITATGNLLCYAAITTAFLTNKERQEAKEKRTVGICSGTVAFPGKGAEAFLKAWEMRWRSFDLSDAPFVMDNPVHPQLWDECALQTMCIRKEIDWEFIPYEKVLYPAFIGLDRRQFSPKVIGLHFVGPIQNESNKMQMLEWMCGFENPLAAGVMVEKIKASVILAMPKTEAQTVMESHASFQKAVMNRFAEMQSEIDKLKQEKGVLI